MFCFSGRAKSVQLYSDYATGANVCIKAIRKKNPWRQSLRQKIVHSCFTHSEIPMTMIGLNPNDMNWSVASLTPVLFSDESRFSLDPINGCVRVCRLPWESYRYVCSIQHNRCGGGSLIIEGNIQNNLLALQQNSMTTQRYQDEVLDITVRPYILINDNTPPHRTRIVQQCMDQELYILRMEGLACSPICYPTEHLRDLFQLAIARYGQQAYSLREVENSMVPMWNAVSQIQRLPKKHTVAMSYCHAVIANRGLTFAIEPVSCQHNSLLKKKYLISIKCSTYVTSLHPCVCLICDWLISADVPSPCMNLFQLML
jgi:hypothetical protein